jgi:large subunit ribosomal protein L5
MTENKMKKTPKEVSVSSSKNKMRQIRVEKIVLNIGTNGDPERMKKAAMLLKNITHKKIVETHSKKRLAAWKIRIGLPIGVKVTLRGKEAEELLKRLLIAVENKVKPTSFTKNGFSFGVPEYIDIPDVRYDPKIGIIGLEASVALMRAGYRVGKRRLFKSKVNNHHTITKEEAAKFAQEKFEVKLEARRIL